MGPLTRAGGDGTIIPPAGGGRWRRDPHPVLRPFVVEAWALARDLRAMGGFTITPDAFGELLCCPDGLVAVADGARAALPSCTLLPLLAGPLRVEAPGMTRVTALRLRPWAVGRLADRLPGPRVAGCADAGALLGRHRDLALGMVTRGAWDDAAEVLEQALLGEVGRWGLDADDRAMVAAFLGDDAPPTGRVAERGDTSRRQVERRVRALTGTSPRQLAGLARFQRSRDLIWADPGRDLSRLALEAGYADQSHLTREFRRYAGQTPRRFARESRERQAWLARQDVAFVQDREARRP